MRHLIAGLGLGLILSGWWSPTVGATSVDQVCKAVPAASVGLAITVERSDKIEPVAGAVVTLYRVDKGYKGRSDLVSIQQTTTTGSGSYCFVANPDLHYRIKLEALPLGLAIKARDQLDYQAVVVATDPAAVEWSGLQAGTTSTVRFLVQAATSVPTANEWAPPLSLGNFIKEWGLTTIVLMFTLSFFLVVLRPFLAFGEGREQATTQPDQPHEQAKLIDIAKAEYVPPPDGEAPLPPHLRRRK